MMNNDDLKKQIDFLKQENLKLKTELETYKLLEQTNITIDKYYLNKYLTTYNEIVRLRIASIDKEIADLNLEYQNLSSELNQNEEIRKLNILYQEKVAELEAIKEQNINELSNLENEYKSLKQELDDKQTILKNATLGYYKTILKSMENDSSLVMINVQFVMEQLSEQLYLLILECRSVSYKFEQVSSELDSKKEIMLKENEDIINQINILKEKIETRTDEELSILQESIHDEINRRVNLKQELIDTFNSRKESDLKAITDKINFYHLTDTPKEKTCELLEELITSLLESLKSQDTFKNLRAIKEMHLIELLKQKQSLDRYKVRYNKLKDQEDMFYNAYMESSKLYDELVDFLENAVLVISENINYYQTSKKFLSLKKEEVENSDLYNIVVSNIEKLTKERDSKLLSSFPQEDIKELSIKLSELNNEKNRLSKVLREIRDEIRNLEKDPENIKLLTVLREKEFVEAKLNPLYNSLRALKVKINKVKEELKSFEVIIKNYDELCKEIEGLENELKHQ